jgi:desulfoferrodoxin (superoxide reductase-like protein)
MKQNVASTLAAACLLFVAFQVNSAFADVPVVNGVSAWTRESDNHTILNITITHHNYFSGHYVNWVKINVSGTINTMGLNEPQPETTFTVQYDLGIVSQNPTVQVMANCNLHGSSSWSEAVQVSEFDSLHAPIFIIALMSILAFALAKKNLSKRD